jgi:hypothetical protein
LRIESEKLEELLNNHLVNFFKDLEKRISNELSQRGRNKELDLDKIAEFKKSIVQNFNQNAQLRRLLQKFGILKEKLSDVQSNFRKNLFFTLIERANFFDDWDNDVSAFAYKIGLEIAKYDFLIIWEKLSNKCQEIKKDEIEQCITESTNPDDLVIIGTWGAFESIWNIDKKFYQLTQKEKDEANNEFLVAKLLIGELQIPVCSFSYWIKSSEEVLILNKKNIGELIQFSPFEFPQPENGKDEVLDIQIKDLHSNQELIEQYLENPPDWLKSKGDKEKQREYLETRVQIEVFESFEFYPTKRFEGYKIKV